MNIAKKIINSILILLALFGVAFTVLYAVIMFTDKDLYNDSTATYSSSVTDPQSGEKISPLTVAYFENYNNLGKEVVEFRFNCYSDYKRTALYTRGYQLIIDKEKGNELWYYDGAFGLSFPSGHKYDEKNDDGQAKEFYYIDIDEDVWAVRLDGTYTVTTRDVDALKAVRTGFTFGLNLLFEDANYYVYNTETYHYTMSQLLLKMKDIVKGCSYGTGEYTMPLVDLGDFLHMYEVKDGKVSDEAVGAGSLQNSYFAIDVKYDRRGLAYADQSLFESVANDSSYNVTGVDFDVNYWQAKSVYTLTEQDFVSRYSSVDDGFYYSLSADIINSLKRQDKSEIIINFNISKLKNINVLGFDYYALNGISVKELTISNSRSTDFNLLVGALQNTGLTKIKTHNVTVNNLSGSEVAYEMV